MQLKNNFTRFLLSSAFALIFAANAYAIPRTPRDSKSSEVCSEKPKPGPFGFSFPKDIGLSCPKDFYFSAEYLLMQAKQDGLDYAIQDTNGDTSRGSFANGQLNGGTIEGFSNDNRDWAWDSGFRVNLGFYLNHDAWNLDAQWTWFRFTEDTSSTTKGSGRLLPFWLVPSTLPAGSVPAREASARWKMHYNVFDISLGKPHHISRYVIFNPFFGVRAAWIDQDYLARYGGTHADSSSSASIQTGVDATASNDLWGIGTRGGLKTEWLLGTEWSLYGDVSASMLFTKFDIDQSVAQNTNTYSINQKFYANTPNFELLLGIGWNHLFNESQHRFGLRASYEFSHWWDANRLRRFYDNTISAANDAVSRGDLTLNGLSFRVMFDF